MSTGKGRGGRDGGDGGGLEYEWRAMIRWNIHGSITQGIMTIYKRNKTTKTNPNPIKLSSAAMRRFSMTILNEKWPFWVKWARGSAGIVAVLGLMAYSPVAVLYWRYGRHKF